MIHICTGVGIPRNRFIERWCSFNNSAPACTGLTGPVSTTGRRINPLCSCEWKSHAINFACHHRSLGTHASLHQSQNLQQQNRPYLSPVCSCSGKPSITTSTLCPHSARRFPAPASWRLKEGCRNLNHCLEFALYLHHHTVCLVCHQLSSASHHLQRETR